MSFNGGKQGHIFKTEKDASGGDSDNAMTYIAEWNCPESKEAMFALRTGHAQARRKIDGSCGAIIRGPDGRWNIYQRFDDKKNRFKNGTEIPVGYIHLPDGENTKVYSYQAEHTHHRYYFKLLDRVQKSKGEQSIVNSLYSVVDRDDVKLEKDYYSVELVGPNFNSTPGMSKNGIALHEAQEIAVKIPELDEPNDWFIWFKEYFKAHRDEGLIISYKGRYWKIHGYKFCPDLPKDYMLPVLL